MCNTGAHMSLFIVVILMLNSCQETIPVSTIDLRFLLLRTPTCKFASTYFWKLLYKLSKKRDIVNDTHTNGMKYLSKLTDQKLLYTR